MDRETRVKPKRPGLGRRIAAIALVLAAFAMAITGLIFATPADASPRSDAVRKKEESQKKIASLETELDGIDDELVSLFRAVEQSKIEVADLQLELSAKETALADAEREHASLLTQLEDAKALQADIATSIEVSEEEEVELQSAVGAMVREMYRGEAVTPFQVAVSTKDLGEISSRAAAATALTRAQAKAIDDVRTTLVVAANQQEKQGAVTTRIADLEEKAQAAKEAAEQARNAVAASLQSVQVKLAEQEQLQVAFEAKKAETEQMISSANDDMEAAAREIAEIDRKAEEERLRKAEEARKQAEQAASKPAPSPSKPSTSAPSGGSSSSSSTTTPQPSAPPSSGGLFSSPFRFPLRVTSPYGWRMHPILGYSRFHNGVDFGAGCGTTQYATRAGTVVQSGYHHEAGNYVFINHGMVGGKSYSTWHSHLSQRLVSVGQQVTTSTPIGLTGTTGLSTGCHLHLILFVNGSTANFLSYM